MAQPACGGADVLGAGAEGQAAERADGAVVRGVGEANFDRAEKWSDKWWRQSWGAAKRLRRNTAPQRRVRLVSFLKGRARGGRTAQLCPTQDRHLWPLKMAPRKLGPWSWGGAALALQRLSTV